MIKVSATGNLISGHVLDCARAPLEAKLREYDPQLYIKWNPKKLRGWGCWELRRRPDEKVPTDYAVYQGDTYVRLEYKELNLINHVMDIPFLNYSVFTKLQKMDTWNGKEFGYKGKHFAKEIEYLEAKYDEKIDDLAATERDYNLKQLKSEIRWFKEYLLSGGNPYRLADFWSKQ